MMGEVLQGLAVALRVLTLLQVNHPLHAHRGGVCRQGGVVGVCWAGRAGGRGGGGGGGKDAGPVAVHGAGLEVAGLVVLVLVPLEELVQLAGTLVIYKYTHA